MAGKWRKPSVRIRQKKAAPKRARLKVKKENADYSA